MDLTALPLEIIHRITHKVRKQDDLKNLRLTSTGLAALVAPLLFERLSICLCSCPDHTHGYPCLGIQEQKFDALVERGLVRWVQRLTFANIYHPEIEELDEATITAETHESDHDTTPCLAFWAALCRLVSASDVRAITFSKVSFHFPLDLIGALNAQPGLTSVTFERRRHWQTPKALFSIGRNLRHVSYSFYQGCVSYGRPNELHYEPSSSRDLVALVRQNRATLEEIDIRGGETTLNEVLSLPVIDKATDLLLDTSPYFPSLSRLLIQNNVREPEPVNDDLSESGLKKWFLSLLDNAPSLTRLEVYPKSGHEDVPDDNPDPLSTGIHIFLNKDSTLRMKALGHLIIHCTGWGNYHGRGGGPNWNPLSEREALSELFPALRRLTSLRTLYIALGEFNSKILTALSASLVRCRELKTVTIELAWDNEFSVCGLKPLELSTEQVFAVLPSLGAYELYLESLTILFKPDTGSRPDGVEYCEELKRLTSSVRETLPVHGLTLRTVTQMSIEYSYGYGMRWTFYRRTCCDPWIFCPADSRQMQREMCASTP